MEVKFSQFGLEMVETLEKLHPLPTLLVGGTGWGKSVLVREVSKRLGLTYTSVNAHPGMDIGLLVGMYQAKPNNGLLSVDWSDGAITKAVQNGHAFLFEELSRAPQEAISRLYGLLDNGFRSWTLPEADKEVRVHEDFWFIGTANPTGKGYVTSRLDRALEARFAAIIPINQPLADERLLLKGVSQPIAERLLRFATDLRINHDTQFSTRELVLAAEQIRRGIPLNVVLNSVAAHYPDHEKGIKEVWAAHFAAVGKVA